jgi:hypothetical protein
MALNLKNYTSEVLAITSMGKIERCLVEAGATDISKKYDDGVCRAITFRMVVNQIPLFFQLPAKVDACFKAMWESKTPQGQRQADRKKWVGQAERTAWKIVSDWVEIQLSMIQLEQAEALQIFLPYVYNPATDQTFYESLKEKNFKALLPDAR